MKVFVHLARDKDAREWRAALEAGKLVGLNEETPYGYGRAAGMGCDVDFSRSDPEGVASRLLRLSLRAALGFDLVHAMRQRRAMRDADVISTHTESQFLGAAATLLLTGAETRLLGQDVWLMDRWPSLGWLHRTMYRRLVRRVDLLVFQSLLGLELAQERFPGQKTALVGTGITTERKAAPRPRPARPLRVLAVGNDRHRDWHTLIAAVGGQPDISLLNLSGTVPPKLYRKTANVEVRAARTQAELIDGYEWATVVCVPLLPNCHVSGITAVQEGALLGVPVVATDVGGLGACFARDEVRFVPPGDDIALRDTLLAMARDPDAALAQAHRAQARMGAGVLGAEAYARRHVELSRLLRDQPGASRC
jgi:glycosyltransferase involved in cell wall biosynthesis